MVASYEKKCVLETFSNSSTHRRERRINWLIVWCSSLFVNVRHRSSMFGNVRHRSSMFVNVRHCSSMFVNTPYNGEKYFNDCIMFCKVIDMEWEIHFQIWIPKHYLQAIKLLFQLQKSGIVMHLELDYRTCLWVEVGLWLVPPPLPQMNASKWLILAFDTLYIFVKPLRSMQHDVLHQWQKVFRLVYNRFPFDLDLQDSNMKKHTLFFFQGCEYDTQIYKVHRKCSIWLCRI